MESSYSFVALPVNVDSMRGQSRESRGSRYDFKWHSVCAAAHSCIYCDPHAYQQHGDGTRVDICGIFCTIFWRIEKHRPSACRSCILLCTMTSLSRENSKGDPRQPIVLRDSGDGMGWDEMR